jgi:hypothetical protein
VDVTAAVHSGSSVSFVLKTAAAGSDMVANSKEASSNQPVLSLQVPPPPPPPPPPPGTFTIRPKADTQVWAGSPTTSYGSSTTLEADTEHQSMGAENVYLRFQIGNLGNLAHAKLRLFVNNSSSSGAGVFYVSNTTWSEGATTWNNAPPIDGPQIATIGANAASGTWVETYVSTVVRPNSQLTLALKGLSADGFGFVSREGSNPPQLVVTTVADDTINQDCTVIVPDNPLSASGLATPYELAATDPVQGACHQYEVNQRGFVEAAVFDPATGQISTYHPLLIDKGTMPAVKPVVPTLPANAVVGIWFGSNANVQRITGASSMSLSSGSCIGALNGDPMGQFAYCNAVTFFKAANAAIAAGQLVVPPLGTAVDGQPCPTTRSFFIVDQDQSDNVVTTYLLTTDGLVAQNTAANRTALGANASVIVNPSDERTNSVTVDGALGCTPWKTPSIDDPGTTVPALATNELFASNRQASPIGQVPLNDPFVLLADGTTSLAKTNLYRVGVDQAPYTSLSDAQSDEATYCKNLLAVYPPRAQLNMTVLSARPSPFPDMANSLYNFLGMRFHDTWDNLGCADIIKVANPVTLTTDANGVVTGVAFVN